MTSLGFDRVAERYDESRGTERGDVIAAAIAPWLRPGPVLEIGVGTGVVSAALRRLGHPTVGVDLSVPMLRRALDRLGPAVAGGDALTLPVRSGSVGSVVMPLVLHLVADLTIAVREAARILAPGGRIVVVHGAPEIGSNEVAAVLAPLARLRNRRADGDDEVSAAATAAGLTVRHRSTFERLDQGTPEQAARQLEERAWAYLWDLDDATWAGTVQPVIAALRQLPDQHRSRPYPVRQRLTVLAAAPDAD